MKGKKMNKIIAVTEDVKRYFKEELDNYEPLLMSTTDTPFIFRVLAKKKVNRYKDLVGDYTTWTCWNMSTKVLNHGHYDLSEHNAMKILLGD